MESMISTGGLPLHDLAANTSMVAMQTGKRAVIFIHLLMEDL
jgi:hypothetical protein